MRLGGQYFKEYIKNNRPFIILFKVVAMGYLLLFSISYLTTNTTAHFTTEHVNDIEITAGTWEEEPEHKPDGEGDSADNEQTKIQEEEKDKKQEDDEEETNNKKEENTDRVEQDDDNEGQSEEPHDKEESSEKDEGEEEVNIEQNNGSENTEEDK